MKVFDIAFVGTSLTYNSNGTIADSNGYWQTALKKELRKVATKTVVLYDCGISGATAQILYDNRALSVGLKPKAVVIECGMNDAATAVALTAFKNSLSALVDAWKAKAPQSDIYLMTMNPAIAPAAVWRNTLPDYYQAVRDVAVVAGVKLIDNHPLWGAPTSAQIPVDGVHPVGSAVRAIIVPKLLSVFAPLVSS